MADIKTIFVAAKKVTLPKFEEKKKHFSKGIFE